MRATMPFNKKKEKKSNRSGAPRFALVHHYRSKQQPVNHTSISCTDFNFFFFDHHYFLFIIRDEFMTLTFG